MKRRDFLCSSAASLAIVAGNGSSRAETTQTPPAGFVSLGNHANRWWLLTPEGNRFISLGSLRNYSGRVLIPFAPRT